LKERVIKRDCGLDITRIAAFISVVAIHLLTFCGAASTPINCKSMYLLTFARGFLGMCVPLFIMLTGYLNISKDIKIEKTSLKKFYFKIARVLLTYIFATTLILLFKGLYLKEALGIRYIFVNYFGFLQYSWYVEMYIGLFMIIPFLNILWKGIDSKKGHFIFVVVLCIMVFLPTLTNSFDFQTKGALFKPWLAESFTKIIPSWWVGIYPIVYYYIGAYIKEHVEVKKLDTKKMFGLLCLSVLFAGAFCIWLNYSRTINDGIWSWIGIYNTVVTISFFLFINSIDFSNVNEKVALLLKKISGLTFGAYLISWIPDQIFHKIVIEYSENMAKRYMQAPIYLVLTVFISLALAFVIDLIVKLLFKAKDYLLSCCGKKDEDNQSKKIDLNKDIAS